MKYLITLIIASVAIFAFIYGEEAKSKKKWTDNKKDNGLPWQIAKNATEIYNKKHNETIYTLMDVTKSQLKMKNDDVTIRVFFKAGQNCPLIVPKKGEEDCVREKFRATYLVSSVEKTIYVRNLSKNGKKSGEKIENDSSSSEEILNEEDCNDADDERQEEN